MKKLYLALILAWLILMLIGAFTRVKAQQWEWAKKADATTEYQCITDICTDYSGNVFAIGTNQGMATYNSTFLDTGSFIIKYDTYGNFIWAHEIDGSPRSIHCDEAGNLYVLGNFYEDITFGSAVFYVNGPCDFFLAKFNPSGSLIWAKAFGGTGNDFAADFALDKQGNSYLTGMYQNTILMDSYPLNDSSAMSTSSFFLAKINTAGIVEWANSGPYNNPSSTFEYYTGHTIRLTKTGGMYILGQYVMSSYDECPYYFIMKCNLLGQMQFTREHFDNCFNNTRALAIDDNSNVFYIFNESGHYYYTPILFKYDSLLNSQWTLPLDDGGYFDRYQLSVGLSTDSTGNVYVAGEFGNTHDIDADSVIAFNRLLITKGNSDILIAKFDANANCQWLKTADGKNYEHSYTMHIDDKGTLYVGGIYNYPSSPSVPYDTVTFDNIMLTNDGSWPQSFVAKLNPPFMTNVTIASTKSEFLIFPNPTSSAFTLYCPLSIINSQLKIYNSFGQLIHQQIITSANQQIDLSDHSKGIYFLEAGGERRKIVLN
jgi:hypothetical protein